MLRLSNPASKGWVMQNSVAIPRESGANHRYLQEVHTLCFGIEVSMSGSSNSGDAG
jgi:hypothetical protein